MAQSLCQTLNYLLEITCVIVLHHLHRNMVHGSTKADGMELALHRRSYAQTIDGESYTVHTEISFIMRSRFGGLFLL